MRCLILTPTRELAAQVAENVALYGANLPLRSAVVFGGVKINPQMMKLRKGVDILVATPGRLLDLYKAGKLNLDDMVTRTYSIDESPQAFEDLKNNANARGVIVFP